jgi:hypothetical protein
MRAIKQFFVIGIFGLLIAGAVSVSGFYNPARKKLIGKWDITFEMTQTDLRQMGVTNNPLVAATAQGIMDVMQAEMEVEFRDDDTVSLGVNTFGFFAGESGTWKVGKRSGEQVILAIKFAEEQEAKEWSIEFVDDNTFQMASSQDSRFPASQLVVFRRAQTDP